MRVALQGRLMAETSPEGFQQGREKYLAPQDQVSCLLKVPLQCSWEEWFKQLQPVLAAQRKDDDGGTALNADRDPTDHKRGAVFIFW